MMLFYFLHGLKFSKMLETQRQNLKVASLPASSFVNNLDKEICLLKDQE